MLDLRTILRLVCALNEYEKERNEGRSVESKRGFWIWVSINGSGGAATPDLEALRSVPPVLSCLVASRLIKLPSVFAPSHLPLLLQTATATAAAVAVALRGKSSIVNCQAVKCREDVSSQCGEARQTKHRRQE